MITLSADGTTVTLPEELYWGDEFEWSPVQQAVEPSIEGALLIDVAALQAGRPITLQVPDDGSAWITRADLEQLHAWAAIPGLEMTLLIRGEPRDVVWRHHEKPVISGSPLVHFTDTAPEDIYLAGLKFMEI